ncbi:MAG: TIGR02253 family HAD-type hydrolase [Candidatus Micrarchaeota archaeon]
MVKYVLFDIDDTLFPSTEFSSMARKNALNAMISMGINSDYDALNKLLTEVIKKKGSNYPKHFNELCKQLNVKDPGRFIAAAIGAYHNTKSSIQVFPTVTPTLMKLKQNGYKLYVATSGSSIKQWDKLIRLNIALYFDGVFVSEEVGREKDLFFYKKILKTLNSEPEDCIMIGDREDADILPAQKAGLKTVRMLAGKYSGGPSVADFTIKDISELLQIIK